MKIEISEPLHGVKLISTPLNNGSQYLDLYFQGHEVSVLLDEPELIRIRDAINENTNQKSRKDY